MKKNFIITLVVSLCLSTAFALAESWDDYAGLDRAWDGQKSITNKEFEEVMDALQAKKKKKEAKQRKKKIKKISGGGTSLHPDLNPDSTIPELQSIKKDKHEGILINLPVHMVIDGNVMDKGYYNVVASRDEDKKIYISFYQSQFLKGKVEATETNDDYGEAEVDFAKISGYQGSFVKLIFGSIDFNAYAYIPYVE